MWEEMCWFCVALPLANSLDLLATHDPDADEENEEETPIYEKFDPLLHRDQRRSKRYSRFYCKVNSVSLKILFF